MGKFGDKIKNKVAKTKPYVIFLGVTILILAIGSIYLCTYANSLQSLIWPSAKGTIVKSVVVPKPGSDGHTFLGEIGYVFIANNSQYSGNTVNFENKQGTNRDLAKKSVSKYRPCAKVDVYYKPSNPKENCLEPGLTQFMLVTLILCFAALIMGIIILATGFMLPSSKKLL